jgi:hypothetical protein
MWMEVRVVVVAAPMMRMVVRVAVAVHSPPMPVRVPAGRDATAKLHGRERAGSDRENDGRAHVKELPSGFAAIIAPVRR